MKDLFISRYKMQEFVECHFYIRIALMWNIKELKQRKRFLIGRDDVCLHKENSNNDYYNT